LKDNTGYDLKHLFIGAEGTLGVVTKVALLCPTLPASKCAAFLACTNFEQVCKTLSMAKTHLSEILAAFEFMDAQVLELVQNQKVAMPLSEIYPYSILVETHGSNKDHDQAKMEAFVEAVMGDDVVVDGVLAQNLSQVQDFWKVRESCNPSVAANGYAYKYDISLPVPEFPSFIDEVRSGIPGATTALCANWGHVIDGNLHCNVVAPGSHEKDEDLEHRIEGLVLEGVLKRGGSISAEHGLGQYKHKYLPRIKDPVTLSTMKAVKKLLDPNGIMNPGKYLPPQECELTTV
jgi:FAD/FMN-containing dehydrogenase